MAIKLLLADDSITIQKVVELILAQEGFEIKVTNNGEEALAVIPSFKPDIILADIEMPKINGYQLSEKIKQDPLISSIPVILLAGAFEPIDEELAKQVKADDFIIKPFESQELINKINAALTVSSVMEGEEAGGIAEAEAVGLEEVSVEEAAATEVKIGIPEVEIPSKDELKDIFENTVNERISSLLSSLDLKEIILTSLMPSMKDSVEKILWEVVPDLVERMLKEILKGALESLTKEVEKVIWETVPDLAETMISKEIERIRSEF